MRIYHYFDKARKLGIKHTLKRIVQKGNSGIKVWSQSFWWGIKARNKMGDPEFLKKTTGEWDSIDKLLIQLANRPASSFILPHDLTKETNQLLNQRYPEYISNLLATADAVCNNELFLLNRVYKFPEGIDWHSDPVTQWKFPTDHRSRLHKFIGSSRPVDLIIFWELNRHQYFITLGIAFWLTGDTKYVESFNNLVKKWIDDNPVQHGMNWYYPLEVAIRLLAWTTAFQFFRTSHLFINETGKLFIKSLWQQLEFLSKHLQITRNDFPNNHIIAELTSLVLVSSAFPEFRDSSKWCELGQKLLEEQALAQTFTDGVNKEQATGYHRFITELFSLIIVRSKQGLLPQSLIIEEITEKMFDYIQFSLSPAGTAPLWGDSDYGRALGLGINKDFWDYRPLLSAGAVMYKRSDWKCIAACLDEEAFWMLGPKSIEIWDQLEEKTPETRTKAYKEAGIFIIRDKWTPESDVAYFRCGPFGLGGEGYCAHAHSDLLGFNLWVSGKPILIDSGTYIYHGPLRDQFRGVSAHNTVMVDSQNQAIPKPNFGWEQITNAICLGFI